MSNNLNVTLGVDIEGYKKDFQEAIKVTTKAGNEIERFIAAKMDSMSDVFEKGTASSMKNALKNILMGLRGFGEQAAPYMDIVAEQFHAIDEAQKKVEAGLVASSGERSFAGMAAAASVASAAFTATTAAQELLGAESENLQKAMLKVQSAMALGQAIGQIKDLEKEFLVLKTTLLANPILAVVAGVIALGTAAVATAASLDDLSAAENAQLEVSKQAAESAAEEAAKINVLAAIVDDANLPYARRKEALDLLNQISPETFGNIKLEGLAYGAAGKAAEQYTRTLVEQAKAKASLDLITEARKKQIQIETDGARKLKGDLDFSDYLYIAAGNGHQIYANLNKDWQESEDLIKSLEKSILKTATAAENSKRSLSDILDIKPTGKSGGASAAGKTDNKKEYGDKLYNQRVPAEIQKITNSINDMGLAAPAAVKQVQVAFDSINPANIEKSRAEVKAFTDELVRIVASGAIDGFANVITAAISGEDISKALGSAFASILTQMGDFMIEYGKKAILMSQAMQAIQLAIASGIPGMAIPGGIIMVAAGAALKGIASSFNKPMPKYADGGIAFGQTVGMFGEYPNANINPEVVAPLSDLTSMMGNGGGDMQLTGKLVARGEDLLVVVEAAKKKRSRG